MLQGTYFIRLDDKGRIKLPTDLRSAMETEWGNLLYVTSVDGVEVKIYPLPVWEEIARKLAKAPSMNPAIVKFIDRTAYYGRSSSFDQQGRSLIHPLLRQKATLEGQELALLGRFNHLALWNDRIFQEQRLVEPITAADRDVFQSFGI